VLVYAHHARNTTEHTIQEFAVDWKGPLTAVPTHDSFNIERLADGLDDPMSLPDTKLWVHEYNFEPLKADGMKTAKCNYHLSEGHASA
jgi:hypothetical protein